MLTPSDNLLTMNIKVDKDKQNRPGIYYHLPPIQNQTIPTNAYKLSSQCITGNGLEPEHESAVEAAIALDGGAATESPLASPASTAGGAGQRKHSPPRHPHPHITKETLEKHGAYAADFRGEALTFKVGFSRS